MTVKQTTLLTSPTIGLEEIQRTAFYVFFEGMNNAIAEIESYWDEKDQIFDERTGRSIYPTTLEVIPPDNFHEGHKPSLIQGLPDNYPNLAVFGITATPSSESDRLDQLDSWEDSLLVEVMVKAPSEDFVNRRIQRTSEAVVLCLRRNPTLGQAVLGLSTAPDITISDVFAMKADPSDGGYGDRLLWQGSQIRFRVKKDSILPGDGAATFENAPQINYSDFIDQG